MKGRFHEQDGVISADHYLIEYSSSRGIRYIDDVVIATTEPEVERDVGNR